MSITIPLLSKRTKTIESVNLFDGVTYEAGYIISNGTRYNDAAWWCTGLIEVIPGKDITFNRLSLPASSSAGIGFYKNGEFVSWISTLSIANNVSTGISSFVVPDNVNQIRVSFSLAQAQAAVNKVQIQYGKVPSTYVNYTEPEEVDYLKNLIKSDLNNVNLPNHVKYIEKEKYNIYMKKPATDFSKEIKAVHGDIVAMATHNTIEISTKGINGPYEYIVEVNPTNFPGMISYDSSIRYIENILIIPWTRNMTSEQKGTDWRLVVITVQGQIYHNFPKRAVANDGTALDGDIIKFEESFIWDLPERKYPSLSSEASGTERYYPCLEEKRYVYHPMLNTDENYVDTYGNGGEGKSITKDGITYPRFSEPNIAKTISTPYHSYGYMGGYEPTRKLTLIGTYRSNLTQADGARICVFATSDGGRNWYNKYEFANQGTTSQPNATGENVNLTGLASAYTANAFTFKKRTNIVPTAAVKEPAEKFSYGNAVVVSDISRANPAVVTATAHGLLSGDLIVFQTNSGSSPSADWDWMKNDTAGVNNGGNGVAFKVVKITNDTFSLREHIHSMENNLSCRHIHSINRIKDGYIIATGENYPWAWILYLQVKDSDTFGIATGYGSFPIYRLTSTPDSIGRPLGVIMLDDADSTIFVASDEARRTRNAITLPSGRTDQITRSSTGIFKGKLADADNFKDGFSCIFEAEDVAFYFKEKANAWVFCGMTGEVAISFDKGVTWYVEKIPNISNNNNRFVGVSKNMVFTDSLIFEFK